MVWRRKGWQSGLKSEDDGKCWSKSENLKEWGGLCRNPLLFAGPREKMEVSDRGRRWRGRVREGMK